MPDYKKKAESIYMKITSYSPVEELGGIEKSWIIEKIAEGLTEVAREVKDLYHDKN